AETSADDVIWDKDATYSYYPHGPMKRVQVGEDNIQGLDHTYTIQGWLKGINDPLLQGDDAGHDGMGISSVARDAFGMMLSYYDGDFTRSNSVFNEAQPGNSSYDYGLYNGNIHAWAFKSQMPDPNFSYVTDDELAFHYRYDVLNRLRAQRSQNLNGSNGWVDMNPNKWATNYRYDANGNFEPVSIANNIGINRFDAAGTLMDEIQYDYDDPIHPDRLTQIGESINGNVDDLAEDHAYQYDEIGQLESDSWNTEANLIEWTAYGKVKDVRLANGRLLRFLYDAAGHRILKADIAQYTNGFDDVPQNNDVFTYYVRDAQGNIMATYRRIITDIDQNIMSDVTSLQEQPIYGSSRLGLRTPRGVEVISGTWENENFEILTEADPTIFYKSEVDRLYLAGLNLNGSVGNEITGYETDPISPTTISPHFSMQPAGTTDNMYRAETTDGTLLFKTFTTNWNGNLQLLLRDSALPSGNVVYNSDGLRSNERGATLSAQVPGETNLHYLFTIYDHKPLVNTFDASLTGNGSIGEITNPKNTQLDPDWNNPQIVYSHCMAIIDDRTGYAPSMLYLERYNSILGRTEIIGVNLEIWKNTGDQALSTTILDFYFSKENKKDYGEMQVSPDGRYLAVTSRITLPGSGLYNWGDHTIRLYEISEDRLTLTLQSPPAILTNKKVSGLDFSPEGNFLYYVWTGNYDEVQGHHLRRLTVPGLGADSYAPRPVWDVRRTKHGQMLYTKTSDKTVRLISNPDDAAPLLSSIWTCTNQTLLPHVALQPLIIYKEEQHLYSRQLDEKNYELTDHLGNVRSVVSDRKLSTYTNMANADPTDFRAFVVSRSDYYPFGSLLPGRNENTAPYRFAFNGMEKDDEMHNAIGTSYDFGARIYDPRLGRWLSI
ncbi:MAG: hypothetical protein M3R08_05105, partial [Bacteroidota bacterium]|nr:hypothetical protein [Bacteroidota bacterium]